ncbi:MAG: hypothetical protein ACREP9_05430, partial [Candidatus Dormibacteraceae bacterium]
MAGKASGVARLGPGSGNNRPFVADSGVTHPAGELIMATPQNKARLSRQAKRGQAYRVAPGLYVIGSTLPLEDAIRHHRLAIIAKFWPAAVIGDRTALAGGEPCEGWMFVSHPKPPRTSDLLLPGLAISVRTGPGSLPGDMPMPHGLYLSGPARGLVENISAGGRPPIGRPARQVGTMAVEDRIDDLARTGGTGKVRNILAQLDVVAPDLPLPAVNLVREHLVAVLGTSADNRPASSRLAARLAGEPYDERRIAMFKALAELLGRTAPVPRPAI